MIQTHITRLKLHDDDWKSLGGSGIVPGSVKCVEGLVEGQDFEVDLERGTVRRLRPFGRELFTFVVQYDDHAEERAARETLQNKADVESTDAKKSILEQIDGALADYDVALAAWDKLTAAQQKAALKRLVQVQAQLLRYHRRELL